MFSLSEVTALIQLREVVILFQDTNTDEHFPIPGVYIVDVVALYTSTQNFYSWEGSLANTIQQRFKQLTYLTMSENGEPLGDVTNKVANLRVNEEAIKRVRDAQWAEPQKFDYNTYNAGPRDAVSAAGAAGAEAEANAPSWASSAMKYEWSEEYGDVAPRHEALEKMLFKDENRMETGDLFKQ